MRSTKTFILTLGVLIVLTGSGCRKCDKETGETWPPTKFELVFGHYYGECFGDCFHVFGTSNGKLFEDQLAQWYTLDYAFAATNTLSQANYDSIEHLLHLIPDTLRNSNKEVYGSPDSHDQGGIYIGLDVGTNRERIIRLDQDDTPDQTTEIVQFKKEVFKALISLQ